MTPTAIRRSLELTQEQWDHLDALAIDFETVAERGPNAKMPSWRALIGAIAAGNLVVSRPAE